MQKYPNPKVPYSDCSSKFKTTHLQDTNRYRCAQTGTPRSSKFAPCGSLANWSAKFAQMSQNLISIENIRLLIENNDFRWLSPFCIVRTDIFRKKEPHLASSTYGRKFNGLTKLRRFLCDWEKYHHNSIAIILQCFYRSSVCMRNLKTTSCYFLLKNEVHQFPSNESWSSVTTHFKTHCFPSVAWKALYCIICFVRFHSLVKAIINRTSTNYTRGQN